MSISRSGPRVAPTSASATRRSSGPRASSLPAAAADAGRRPADSLSELLGARATDPNAPLPPGKVFRVSAELANPALLRVTWTIAEGYYLYRDSLKVESASPGSKLGALRLPAGTPKEDEYWGKTEVFYEEAVAEVPSPAAPTHCRSRSRTRAARKTASATRRRPC